MKTFDIETDNVGGLFRLLAVPQASCSRVRKDYAQKANYIELKRKDDVIEIPACADMTFSFTEENQKSENGDAWNIEIEGVVPGTYKKNSVLVEELERGEWYVYAVDQNGCARWCGTDKVKMYFTATKSSGDSFASRNGISFTLSCIQESPSLPVDGVNV